MREKGVQSATRAGVIGDQIVEISIVVPEMHNVEAKELWQKLEKLHPEDPRAELWSKVSAVEMGGSGVRQRRIVYDET